MCGIIGLFSLQKTINRETFGLALDSLAHRGPDDRGVWFSEDRSKALGHRRLSFIDLSPSGRQPLASADGTIVVTFNGELYNYKELRHQLKDAHSFRTETDTEVLVAAYLKWGIGCLEHLRGMFAFGLYDARNQKVFMVRDRFGIKPLYYSLSQEGLKFASELKAILQLDSSKRDVDFSSMADYFVYRYVPSPKTIWKGVQKLAPAHYLEYDLSNGKSSLHEYWKIFSDSRKVDPKALAEEVSDVLESSVKEHLRADVPIGSFLSGGYDSSALAYYMKKAGSPPDTFSVGFEGWKKSEDQFARQVSEHLGLTHQSTILDEKSLALTKLMPTVYDEPIADISIVPTYAVSKLASAHVKAVFSGEGADELLGGYAWQHEFHQLSHPEGLRERLKRMLNPIDTVGFYANSMAMGWFDDEELKELFTPDFHKFIPEDVHWFYRKHYRKEFGKTKGIQYLDVKSFMAELVLTKVDRASMANSLEVRVPFLDHRLFELVFGVSESSYIHPEQTKYILYQCVKDHLPEEILARKKQGFVGPDSYYMNNEWYKKELTDSKLVSDGIIRRSYIDNLLGRNYDWKLWKILIMEKWYVEWVC